MPRYIDADKLIAHLKDELKGCHLPFGSRAGGKGLAYGTVLGLKSAISFAETLSTEDVVPKSDLASEIFTDIEKIINRYCKDYKYSIADVLLNIAELRRKYTEGEDGTHEE